METVDGLFFDVKGLTHPKKHMVAFLRFLPDQRGDRKRNELSYRKVYALSERYLLLKEKFPQYLVYDPVFDENMCEVPVSAVKHLHKSVNRLREMRNSNELDSVETDALEFAELLKCSSNIPWSKIGISGSILIKLHTPDSDVDPIVYGSENCRRVYSALKGLHETKKGSVKPYDITGLKALFDFRSRDTSMSFEDFVRTESRKVMQGKFRNRDYFIRFVKDWNEIEHQYGAIRYTNMGYAKIKAEIKDDSEAIFTPCSYKIKNVSILEGVRFPIEEIASFRGRFCKHVRIGEVFIAQGKVERVTDNKQDWEYFRLLLGNKPSDYMVLA